MLTCAKSRFWGVEPFPRLPDYLDLIRSLDFQWPGMFIQDMVGEGMSGYSQIPRLISVQEHLAFGRYLVTYKIPSAGSGIGDHLQKLS